jgi:hypothetical protein
MSGHKKGVFARDGENYATGRFVIPTRNMWKRILIENPKAYQLLKKIPYFMEPRKSIVIITRGRTPSLL